MEGFKEMAANPSKALAETQQNQHERAKQWGEFFRQLVREWQYADESGRRVFLSKSDLARLIKVSDVTIGQWWDSKAYPSRANCGLVATAFGKNCGTVLRAAGYEVTQDDGYKTINEILATVQSSPELSDAERKRQYDALVTTMTPAWIDANPDWIELVQTVLNQKMPAIAKAERIAALVELAKGK